MANRALSLPYGRQLIGDDDVAAVAEVLRSDWLTTGPAVAAFEGAFAAATGAKHAVSCANGTAALHLAILALGLEAGDVVIVPSITFLATANAARFAGADVAFADVDPRTGLMTPESMMAAYANLSGERRAAVKAVLPVHLNGQLCDIAAIRAAASAHGWAVIEDACHALGGAYADGAPIGDAHNMATFSFHPVKAIASGEGGMITTGDPNLAERLSRLRNHGIVRDEARFEDREAGFDGDSANPWYYEMPEIGFNYRLSDIHAALARSQLGKLKSFIARREELVARYDRRVRSLVPLVRPIERTGIGTPAWHLYVVQVDFAAAGMSRGALMNALRRRGIGTQVHYVPLHRQPYYRRLYGQRTLPGAEAYYASALSLPLFAAMRDVDVDTVVDALEQLCRP